MSKTEIIESIAYADVPHGTTLVERSEPALGVIVARFDSSNADGLRISMARIFAAQLEADTADLSGTPDSNFFRAFHEDVISFNKLTLTECLFGTDCLVEEMAKTIVTGKHQKMVAKIREIAKKLGIAYKEPEDPLLK